MAPKTVSHIVKIVTIGLVIGAALWLRLYRFTDRVTLSMEQGMTLSTTASYIYDKFSLLGMANVQRVTNAGHMVLVNPLYNYLLIPALFLTHGDPIHMTFVALLINLITGGALYYIARAMQLSRRISFLAVIFFLFNTVMIEQSLTLWIHNAVPLIGLLTTYFLYLQKKRNRWWITLLLGLLSGTGYAFEYLYIATALLVLGITLVVSKNKWATLGLWILGFMVPQIPVIAFDMRHDWYTMRTLWEYAIETLHSPSQSRLNVYHFFQFIPLACTAGAVATDWVWGHSSWLGAAIVIAYIGYCTSATTVAFGTATPAITAPDIIHFSSIVAERSPVDYNIVYEPDSEYRAYVMRYLLTYLFHRPPLGIEAYPSATELFVVAPAGMDVLKDAPWEIASSHPKKATVLSVTGDKKYALYELTR